MGRLHACVLQVTLEACDPIHLGPYPGSAVRGALFESLLRRFCVNPKATSCLACPLHETCPVSGFVAPLRDEHPRGRDLPRPFVLAMSPQSSVSPLPYKASMNVAEYQFQPGDQFRFSLTLLGSATGFFPYIILSLPLLESQGLGSKLQSLGGRRGRIRVSQVEAVHPFHGVMESVYTGSQLKVQVPSLKITAEDVASRAVRLPTHCLTIQFLTPTRLIGDGHLLLQPLFRPLALRLAERLEELEVAYGEEDDMSLDDTRQLYFERYTLLDTLSREVESIAQQIKWVELASYSSRQQRTTPISGFIGRVTYTGNLAALRELLVWGEVIHVGKNAVKGNGCYRILPEPLSLENPLPP